MFTNQLQPALASASEINASTRRLNTLVDSAMRGNVPVDALRSQAQALKAQVDSFLRGLPSSAS